MNNLLSILKIHHSKYPEMEFDDVYKLIFQFCYGPNHMDMAKETIYKNIKVEASSIKNNKIEITDIGNNFIRVSIINDDKFLSLLTDTFSYSMQNDKPYIDIETILEDNKLKICEIFNFDLGSFNEQIKLLKFQGFPPISHSQKFKELYNPHYRVIDKKFLSKEIMEYLQKNIKTIFIDIDNTLLDFDLAVINAFKTGFQYFNLGEYKDSYYDTFTKINNGLWEQLEKKEISFEELKRVRFNRVFLSIGVKFDGIKFESYFREQLHAVVFPIDGSIELLKYLKQKYLIVLASNGPQNQQVTRIKLAKMNDYVDYIFTSEFIGYSKPSKEYFDKAFNLLSSDVHELNRDECLMIGDSLTSDINGAKSAGMYTIFFDKHHSYTQTPSPNIDLMVEDLSEIKNYL